MSRPDMFRLKPLPPPLCKLQIYIVGTAHISSRSQEDVVDIIEKVGPAVVVLELDPERLRRLKDAAARNDTFGLQRYHTTNPTTIMRMALTGDLLGHASGLFYAAAGALMGTRPGGEFLAAADAAEQIGARVVCADRDQMMTMRRLQWYTRQLIQARKPGRFGDPFPGSFPGAGRDPSALPDLSRSSEPSYEARRAEAEVRASSSNLHSGGAASEGVTANAGGSGSLPPWGLEEDDADAESAMKARLLRMMREGGCPQPNAVLAAAQRLLRDGLDPKAPISPADVLEVRGCGTTLVETFRRRALAGDDDWMKSLEVEPLAGAKGVLGAQRSRQAMQKVIIDERDCILAEKIWEAGREAGQQGVVAVLGAGHVRGIQRHWAEAGTPEMHAQVEEYMRPPRGEGTPSALGVAFTGGVVGYIAYRRPKAAGVFLGAMALATAPYLVFSVFTMRRFTAFADKLARVSQQLGAGEVDAGAGGWTGDGIEEWR